MKHAGRILPDDVDTLPANAVVTLDHAFRREFARAPSRRQHVRMERERTRRFVDAQGRCWSLGDR